MGLGCLNHGNPECDCDLEGEDVGTCPKCGGDSYNFDGHFCDEDCRRRCRIKEVSECDACLEAEADED